MSNVIFFFAIKSYHTKHAKPTTNMLGRLEKLIHSVRGNLAYERSEHYISYCSLLTEKKKSNLFIEGIIHKDNQHFYKVHNNLRSRKITTS